MAPKIHPLFYTNNYCIVCKTGTLNLYHMWRNPSISVNTEYIHRYVLRQPSFRLVRSTYCRCAPSSKIEQIHFVTISEAGFTRDHCEIVSSSCTA